MSTKTARTGDMGTKTAWTGEFIAREDIDDVVRFGSLLVRKREN